MRVTNQMIAAQTLQNITGSLRRLEKYNNQLATGKRLNVPSDDPTGAELAMRLKTAISETEQYLHNVDDAESWLNAVDAALQHVTQVIHRARELAISAGNETFPSESLEAIAKEVDQLIEDIVQAGNEKYGQKFVFGGENTLSQPFVPTYDENGVITGVTYTGTTGEFDRETDAAKRATLGIQLEIGPGITMRLSVHGDVAIMPAIDALMDLRENLRSGNVAGITGKGDADSSGAKSSLELIDDALDAVLMWQAETGARGNRLQLVRDRLTEAHTNLTKRYSERVDVDVVEAIMNLRMEESVYQAALAASARIIQPTLLDFLR